MFFKKICYISIFSLFSAFYSLAQLPTGFIKFPVAENLNPTSFVIGPDGRIFITEKNGLIKVVENGEVLSEPLLRIEVDNANERGLGKMVLHPDFETNGYYYVYYTIPGIRTNRVSRFTANGNLTIPGSEKVIIEMDEMGADVHNGGAMVFGFDGYLYVATGDGNQSWRGEDLGSPNAKVIRIDEDGNPAPDNPWKDLNYQRSAYIYASGLRNPFTLALHPLTGDIYVNDVGGYTWEEINKIEKGRFYGWPRLEGFLESQEVPDEYKDPEYVYKHENYYCCIVGSTFYFPQTSQFPESYEGMYFYADYCSGHIRMLDPNTKQDKGIFMTGGNRVIDMKVSKDGSLYYLERRGLNDGSAEDNTATDDGVLWKIEYTGSGSPFIGIQPEDQLVAEGETATFTVTSSGSQPISYKWRVNGEVLYEGDQSSFQISSATIEQDSSIVTVEVINSFGSLISEVSYLLVTSNKRPVPVIDFPVAGSTYKAGDVINFSGHADDNEDGVIPNENMSWRIDFHHNTHSHPGMPWTSGINSGTFTIPASGETASDVWYRIHYNVHDQDGLLKSVYTDITPELGKVDVLSEPVGLDVALDGVFQQTPYQIEGVQGISRFISPPIKQVRGNNLYFFTEWNDGSKVLNREVKCNQDDQVFSAKFERVLRGRGNGLTAYYYPTMDISGEPVGTAIDSMINHQYFKSPFANIPDDFWAIKWKGYIQPQVTGLHEFYLYGDDLVYLSIDNTEVIKDEEYGGGGNKSGFKYLEKGRLYPIEIHLIESEWYAYIDFRWKTENFPDERVPSYQLFPDDELTTPDAFNVVSKKALSGSQFQIQFESYKEALLPIWILSSDGRIVRNVDLRVIPGRNILNLNLDGLASGIYFVRGQGEEIEPFIYKVIKAN